MYKSSERQNQDRRTRKQARAGQVGAGVGDGRLACCFWRAGRAAPGQTTGVMAKRQVLGYVGKIRRLKR